MSRTPRRVEKAKKRYKFLISWDEFEDPEDLDWDLPARTYSGWYATVQIDGSDFDIGPSFEDDGFKTVDEALAYVEQWCRDRKIKYHRPFISMDLESE